MAKPVTVLMQKEMTRKEFVTAMAFGAASLMGFSTLIHLLTGKSLTHNGVVTKSYGYGSTAYGGGKD